MEPEGDEWCIHGEWKNSVCECEADHATYFDETALTQKYCDSSTKAVALLRVSYEPRHYLYLTAMTITVLVTVAAFMAFTTAIASMVETARTKRKINAARHALIAFGAGVLKRDSSKDLTMALWTPPSKFKCINQQKEGKKKGSTRTEAKAVAAYQPQNKGELSLKPGMTLTDVVKLDGGWCKGTVEGKTGFFPAAFVEML